MSRYSEPPHHPHCPCRECGAGLIVEDMRRGEFNDVLRRSVGGEAKAPGEKAPLPLPRIVRGFARLIEVLRGGG